VTLAAEKLSARLQEAAKKAADASGGQPESWTRLLEAARAMAEPALRDTIHYDMVATAEASAGARGRAPVLRTIEAGEIIQDRGKRWTEQSRADVRAYLNVLQSDEQPLQRVFMMAAREPALCLLAIRGVYPPLDHDVCARG
jgi:hypothetical protein